MTSVKVVVAIAVSVLLLYLARTNSEGRPELISHTENGFTFEMTTVPKALEAGQARIPVKITGNIEPNLRLLFRSSKQKQDETTELFRYGSAPLFVQDSIAGLYYAQVSTGGRGRKLHYYFEIRDNTGGYRASFAQPDGRPFVLKYIGHVPSVVLIGHIAMMSLTVFFLVMGSLSGITLVGGGQNARPMATWFFLAALSAFLGAYPFGIAMNHYFFNSFWEGVPFGTDATDNKTQLLFVYLLFVALVGIGSFSKGKMGRDIYPPRVLGGFGLGAFAIMLAIYLIPHSIQYSPELTKTVSYTFLGLVALLYAGGWIRARLSTTPTGTIPDKSKKRK